MVSKLHSPSAHVGVVRALRIYLFCQCNKQCKSFFMKLFDMGVYNFPTREDVKIPFFVSGEENHQYGANFSHDGIIRQAK